jgi:hypothetical protein
MKEKKLVRFPNESSSIELELDMNEFVKDYVSTNETFGWYKGIYISIKL